MKKINNSILFLLSASILGAVAIYIATINHGLALTSDSVGYVGVARNLIEGNGFTNFNGETFVYQPPLYPLLLAAFGILTNTDILDISSIFHSILHGLIIFTSGLFLLKVFKSNKSLAIVGIIIVLFSQIVFKISTMALSEPLFIFLIILILYLFYQLMTNNSIKYLILLSITVAFSAITKYVGVTLIFWGFISILLFTNIGLKDKIKNSLLFSIISSIPLGLWLIRNILLSGTITGQRTPLKINPFPKINDFINTITQWFIHPKFLYEYGNIINIFLVVLILFVCYSLVRLIFKSKYDKKSLKNLYFIITFILIYSSFLIYSTTKYSVEMDDRLVSPIYIPFIIVMLYLLDILFNYLKQNRSNRIFKITTILFFTVWLLYPLRVSAIHFRKMLVYGQGTNSKEWQNKQIINYLRENTDDYSSVNLFSNNPHATYIHTNMISFITPYKPTPGQTSINPWITKDNSYVIWYDFLEQDALISLNRLKKVKNLIEVIKFEDGTIFRVN